MQTRLSAFALILGLAAITAPGVSANQTNASCDIFDDTEASLWARYIDTGTRATLELKLRVPQQFGAVGSASLPVFLGGQRVGSIQLEQRAGGWASGGLSLDSYAALGQAEPGTEAFPANWPGAGVGSLVRVGRLTCQLL